MKKLKLLSLIGITSIALANAGWAAGHGGGGGGFGGGGFSGGGHSGGGGRAGPAGGGRGGGGFHGGAGFHSRTRIQWSSIQWKNGPYRRTSRCKLAPRLG